MDDPLADANLQNLLMSWATQTCSRTPTVEWKAMGDYSLNPHRHRGSFRPPVRGLPTVLIQAGPQRLLNVGAMAGQCARLGSRALCACVPAPPPAEAAVQLQGGSAGPVAAPCCGCSRHLSSGPRAQTSGSATACPSRRRRRGARQWRRSNGSNPEQTPGATV